MRWLAVIATTALLAGCAEETPAGTPADDFVLPLTKQSLDEMWSASLVEASPSPPAKGNNVWRVDLRDVDDNPVDDADLRVRLFMPLHGHGAPTPDVTVNDNGEYEISRINFIMGGLWEVRFYEQDQAADRDILFLVNVPD